MNEMCGEKIDAKHTTNLRQDVEAYCSLRNHRAQATFNLMMRMAPAALAAVRQEFFARSDSVNLEEFIYIMSKHLVVQNHYNTSPEFKVISNTSEQMEFASSMHELFKEIDMNGDGTLEWEEFTKLTVEKARLLNKKIYSNRYT